MVDTVAATKSAALALVDERALMRQGHQFLDEKRMLLAAEMLRVLKQHAALSERLVQAQVEARQALQRALQRHGLEGLQAYPPARFEPDAPQLTRSAFLGVRMVAATFEPRAVASAEAADDALDASPEARSCCAAMLELLAPLAQLAACSANLERLAAEYRRTERRVKALENVLLPEIERALATMEGRLELGDQEEALRIRLVGRRR
jgi:V/A-type H+-transporting ATPase subunit D